MWRIPTDFYKIKSPSLGFDGDQLIIKKFNRQTIKVEGATFRFIKERDDHAAQQQPLKGKIYEPDEETKQLPS